MRLACILCALLALLSLGCAITNYPVIFDSRGPWGESVMEDQYEQAYIVPLATAATIWSDGSDELYTLVSQDWKGDQWLKTYNNYDPAAQVIFLDQTYCDPNRQTQCAIWTAWNPDLPDAYPHGGPGKDDPFDGEIDWQCSGGRSLSDMLSYGSRVGECGSDLWADKQGLAYEFSMLERTTFRDRPVYVVPIDSTNASFVLTAADGETVEAPIYGRFTVYIDDKLRVIWPASPNMRYVARWRNQFIDSHGAYARVQVTYGSVSGEYDVQLARLDENRY